jgi:diguanylate cyclase
MNRPSPTEEAALAAAEATRKRFFDVLRPALALMLQQPAAPTMQALAVWFAHVGGTHPALSREITALTTGGGALDDAVVARLHEHHLVADVPAREADQRASTALRSVVDHLAATVHASRASTETYQATLASQQQALSRSTGEIDLALNLGALMADTHTMHGAIARLGTSLVTTQQQVEQLRSELAHVREQAVEDALSGLLNRRGFDKAIAEQIDAARAQGLPLTLLMLDIDHFKRVNDQYGHVVGDHVIRGIGHVLRSVLRPTDIAARYGGEEFAVVAPGSGIDDAMHLAEQIRMAVARARLRRLDTDQTIGSITLSAGVASLQERDDATSLVGRADKALYRAKCAGRNQVHRE